jgi:hypothetical protein
MIQRGLHDEEEVLVGLVQFGPKENMHDMPLSNYELISQRLSVKG